MASVTISTVFSDNGIIKKAQEVANKTKEAVQKEKDELNQLYNDLASALNNVPEEPIPPEPTLPSDGSFSEEKGVNTPNLGEGMTPIKWDKTKNDWVETNGSDPEWYDYTAKKWANAKTSDGSMWVWLPRYAYSITSGYHSSTAGNIEIEFMKGLTNETSTGRTTFQNASGQGNWNIHPAFNYGQTVSGIWVAKFEASSKEGNSNSDSGDNVTTKTLQVKPGVSSWRYITIGNMYTVCKNYNSTLNSHMMKNDEWGAVAYLSKSKYGKENEEVWINNSGSYITGSAGNSASADKDVGTTNDYTSTQGVKASTTGNVYGVYDMSGGAYEYVAAYVNNGNISLTSYGASLVNSNEEKTKNVYTKANADNYESNYNQNSGKYGDAVIETSANGNTGDGSWHGDFAYFPYISSPFFSRGASCGNDFYAGMFSFFNAYGSSVNESSFRPVLVALSEPEGPEMPAGWDSNKVNAVESADKVVVPVPKGYTASSVSTENKVSEGFVIYENTNGEDKKEEVNDSNKDIARTTRNQFVWVPVTNPSEMYGTDKDGKRWGKLYKFSSSGITPLNWTEQDGIMSVPSATSYREPDVVTGEDADNSNLQQAGLDSNATASTLKAQLETEFNNMIASVEKYGGFYIGRYETGNLSQEKASVVKNNSDINNQTWYTMYKKAKGIAVNGNVTSTMIWGSQWDATMRWMYNSGNEEKKKYTYDSTGKGHYESGSPIATGTIDAYAVNNIYDMAGNVSDRTIEANYAPSRVIRGGYYGSAGTVGPASNRLNNVPTSSLGDYGFRVALYM